jgi:hypothetical protein
MGPLFRHKRKIFAPPTEWAYLRLLIRAGRAADSAAITVRGNLN